MILNFDYVHVTSPSGMQDWGEFSDAKQLVKKLDELREKGQILSTDYTVFMFGYKYGSNRIPKKMGAVKLSYLGGRWAVPLS